MKIIVSGGGTGGHIYPALAIADKFKKEIDAEILYVGERHGMESKLVPQSGYDFYGITASPMTRSRKSKKVKSILDAMKGVSEARKIIKKFKPDLIIGTGGYASLAVLFAGRLMRVKYYLHEQNAFPGIVNKFMAKDAQKVFLGFGEAKERLHKYATTVVSGNPVRNGFFTTKRDLAKEKIGMEKDKFLVFSVGGSMGAKALNDIMIQVCREIGQRDDMELVFATGNRFYDEIIESLGDVANKENVMIRGYIENMEDYLCGADVVISRSGALSIAEEAVVGTCSILIPFPYASDNHQYYNAKAVSDAGGAILIEEEYVTADKLMGILEDLKRSPEERERMSQNIKKLAPVDAVDIIYSHVSKDLNL